MSGEMGEMDRCSGEPDGRGLFERFFESSPDGVVVSKPDGTILRANPAACRMLGWTEDELRRGGRSSVLVDDERLAAYLAERERGGVVHAELLLRRADGSVFPAEVTSAVLPAADGETYTCVLFRDATERHRAQEALRRYELLAEHGREVILFVRRADGGIVDANAAAAAAYGYSREELRALTIHALRAPESVALTQAQMAAADAQGIRFETLHRRRDGSLFPVEVSSQGATLGETRLLVSVVRDITERKTIEATLREADRRKTEFLGVLSHELRNPLAPMRNSIHLLERAPPGSAIAERAMAVLRRQTDHLSRLVDDLLDVTRISHGKVELKRTRLDAREVVGRTCEDQRSLFEARGVALAVEVGPRALLVDADEIRLAQVVGNVLQNAAKFTPRGGAAAVSATAADGAVEIRVRDTGAGMEPGQIERMFEPFVQADTTLARSQGGLGLGLALVRGLVELHGGTVRASSEGRDRGVEVVVRLPPAAAQPEPERPAPERAAEV
jgi:PAS domain S-box-containing protein